MSHAEHFFINFVGIEVTFLLFSPLSRLAAADLEVILRRFCHTVGGRGCTSSAWLLLHGTFDFFVMFVGFFFFFSLWFPSPRTDGTIGMGSSHEKTLSFRRTPRYRGLQQKYGRALIYFVGHRM